MKHPPIIPGFPKLIHGGEVSRDPARPADGQPRAPGRPPQPLLHLMQNEEFHEEHKDLGSGHPPAPHADGGGGVHARRQHSECTKTIGLSNPSERFAP
jgi:hypothetical protein